MPFITYEAKEKNRADFPLRGKYRRRPGFMVSAAGRQRCRGAAYKTHRPEGDTFPFEPAR